MHRVGVNNRTEAHAGGVGQEEPKARYAAAEVVVSCAKSDPNCTYTGISFDSNFQPIETPHYGATGYAIRHTYWTSFDPGSCDYQQLTSLYSPIVIDLDGDNFATNFTDWPAGILWNFFGREQGTPGWQVQMAWTKAGKNVGFLWLDRNTVSSTPCYLGKTLTGCNGTPDSGKELFGNITYQSSPATIKTSTDNPYVPSGFGALRMLDSNGDGVIDAQDPVYSQLRVWKDLNHNGVLDDGENFTLAQLGITSISTAYVTDGTADQYGNVKQYVGTLTGISAAIYDVFFVGQEQ